MAITCFISDFWTVVGEAIGVSESNALLWIVCTIMVREFHRLGVLLGAGAQTCWLTLSFETVVVLATSQAASDSNICPVKIGVGTPGISMIKT